VHYFCFVSKTKEWIDVFWQGVCIQRRMGAWIEINHLRLFLSFLWSRCVLKYENGMLSFYVFEFGPCLLFILEWGI
jgi:hypothetical protein